MRPKDDLAAEQIEFTGDQESPTNEYYPRLILTRVSRVALSLLFALFLVLDAVGNARGCVNRLGECLSLAERVRSERTITKGNRRKS